MDPSFELGGSSGGSGGISRSGCKIVKRWRMTIDEIIFSKYTSFSYLYFLKVLFEYQLLEMAKTSPSKEEKRRAPKGHFVVYVGEEEQQLRRFVVPISYLKTPTFKQLLDKAAEEHGFDHTHKAIVLPCHESTFQHLIHFMAKNHPSQ
ncbi:Auxin-responsive protein SAUR15 [Camellia lanceoleosa]|uniref:Auxin-responsive protein SAUR15 n=1 Tax=Camellia lanceoleosa TaxID=1840588 RepID=A0ACC0FRE0_9ERIC|nr:Auxin-responsive protein SAUR15 [Camellia lanceoleosa]